MTLALFDLDHTLVPFDTGMAWTRFLIARRVLEPRYEGIYLQACRAYVAGTLDIRAVHRTMVAPLAALAPQELQLCLRDFEATIPPTLPMAAARLVRRHREAGDLCCIVTATTRFISACYARALGIDHLVATEPAHDAQGILTGEIEGLPCYREHKVERVRDWLAGLGRDMAGFHASTFYTDAFGDLPLLRVVTQPVAVHPDARLAEMARQEGWPVLDLRGRV